MRLLMKILFVAGLLGLVAIGLGSVCWAQQHPFNPRTQIDWTARTGHGFPTLICQGTTPPPAGSVAYGFKYVDIDNQAEYTCEPLGGWIETSLPTSSIPLPSATLHAGVTYVANNGATVSDCTTGGGSFAVLCRSNGTNWMPFSGLQGPTGPVGPVGPPGSFFTAGALVFGLTTSTSRAAVFSDVIGLFTAPAGGPCTSGWTQWNGLCTTPTGTVPALAQNQAPVGQIGGNTISGYPTAAAVTPDALQQQGPAAVSQATPIAAVTDTNAKTALSAHDASILALQNALEQAGIYFPNALSSTIASGANNEFILFNPAGASTGSCPTTATNLLALSDNWTLGPTTGGPNFLKCGKGQHQGGWLEWGNIGTGPATVPSGAALSTITTTLNGGNLSPSIGAVDITSSSQIQGGGSLTSATWPQMFAGGTSNMKFAGVSGGAYVCWWGKPKLSWIANGGSIAPLNGFLISKPNEWEIGPGFGAVFNGTAFQTLTLPTTIFAGGASYPESLFQMCLSYNPTGGSFGQFTLFMNDGTGSRTGTVSLTSALTAVSSFQVRPANSQGLHEALLYVAGSQLTQAQAAGMYYGFTSNPNSNPFAMASNRGPTFTSAPGVQWNTYPLVQADMQDCALWTPLNNGGGAGTSFYNGTFSHCHLQAQTSAPVFRATVNVGNNFPGSSVTDVSVRVDGVLSNYSTIPSFSNNFEIEVVPSTTNVSHTYDVNYGIEASTTTTFTAAALYTSLSGIEPLSVSVPNPYTVTFLPQTGTVAAIVGDSILGSGFQANNAPSRGSFVPLERYNGSGTTSFGTARIASLSVGSALESNDFNPTGLTTSITTPDASGTAFWLNYGNAITNNNPALLTVDVSSRVINDYLHSHVAFGGTSNCLAIFMHAEQNHLLSAAAYNPAVTQYVFSALNEGNFGETANSDNCTGDSYTSQNALTNYVWNAGTSTWVATAVAAGTTFTGVQGVSTYRLIQQDVCLTVNAAGHSCTYVELGPGAPALTGGYAVPTLLTTANQCSTGSANTCFFTDDLHMLAYGHFIFTRFINAESWATPITVGQFR